MLKRFLFFHSVIAAAHRLFLFCSCQRDQETSCGPNKGRPAPPLWAAPVLIPKLGKIIIKKRMPPTLSVQTAAACLLAVVLPQIISYFYQSLDERDANFYRPLPTTVALPKEFHRSGRVTVSHSPAVLATLVDERGLATDQCQCRDGLPYIVFPG
jgi:hypothetical protein